MSDENSLSTSVASPTLSQFTSKMARTLRVAILECDTPIDPVRTRFGTYGDIFESLLLDGLKESAADIALQCSKWNVVENPVYPGQGDFDALLLTGSSKFILTPRQSFEIL